MGTLGHPDERSCPTYLQPVSSPSLPLPARRRAQMNLGMTSWRSWKCWISDSTTRARIGGTSSRLASYPPQLSGALTHDSCRHSHCLTTASMLAPRMSSSTSATMSISSRRSKNSSISTSMARTRVPTSAKRQRTSQISSRMSPVSARNAAAVRICVTA